MCRGFCEQALGGILGEIGERNNAQLNHTWVSICYKGNCMASLLQ